MELLKMKKYKNCNEKYTNRVKSRLYVTEENISELEDIVIETM